MVLDQHFLDQMGTWWVVWSVSCWLPCLPDSFSATHFSRLCCSWSFVIIEHQERFESQPIGLAGRQVLLPQLVVQKKTGSYWLNAYSHKCTSFSFLWGYVLTLTWTIILTYSSWGRSQNTFFNNKDIYKAQDEQPQMVTGRQKQQEPIHALFTQISNLLQRMKVETPWNRK